MMPIPERDNLVYVEFDPQAGHEQSGTRPGLILSPKAFNQATGFAIICPITRQQKGYPFEVKLPNDLFFHGVILTDQVKSLDWQARRLQIKGQVPDEIVMTCLDLIHTFL